MAHHVVFGSQGALGSAFVKALRNKDPSGHVHAFSRSPKKENSDGLSHHHFESYEAGALSIAASQLSEYPKISTLIVATGLLHQDNLKPEKSMQQMTSAALHTLFDANAVAPALIAAEFLPLMDQSAPAFFAALSARVGSISDNRLGGWYAYRASKAALNMLLKTLALEMRFKNKLLTLVGLHPGTVVSNLSQPFLEHVPTQKRFTPDFSASALLDVLFNCQPADSGRCFDWQGQLIDP